MMLNLLALLACAKDVPTDSDPPVETDDPVEEDQLPIVRIEGSDFLFGEVEAVQLSGTATDRQTPGELEVTWISDLDGILATATPTNGLVTLRAPEMSVGTHILTLRAEDPDGNLGETWVTLRRNARPSAPSFALLPEFPTDKDDLVVEILEEGEDPDGEELTLAYRWFQDGEEQAFKGSEVPASAVGGAEVWRVEVFSVDGLEPGIPGEASVEIANNAPGTPEAALAPELVASGAEPLQCVVAKAAPEPDGQALSYRVAWTVDGRAYPEAFTEREGPTTTDWPNDTVPAADTALGEQWSCELWASDGSLEGPGTTAYGSAVSYEEYGLTTLQDYSDVLQGGTIISVPIRAKQDGTLFGARINTLTANGEVKMSLYSGDTGKPRDLLGKTQSQALSVGVNTLLMDEVIEVEEGWYYLCFTFSESEELSFKQNAYLDSGYVFRDYSLAWQDPAASHTAIESLFNAWILVK